MFEKKKKGRFPFPFLHTQTKASCKTLVFSSPSLLGWLRSQKCQGNPSPAPNQPQTTVATGNGGNFTQDLTAQQNPPPPHSDTRREEEEEGSGG